MTSEQPHKIKTEVLLSYSEEQLIDILRAEIESDDTDPELIESVNAALASKAGEISCDVDAAYERFQTQYLGTEPLYDDVLENYSEDDVHQKSHIKPRKLVRFAAIAAVLVALLLGGVITASAMGVDLWGAVVPWTSDLFGFSTMANDEKELADFLGGVQSALEERGVTADVVPSYIPDGYHQKEFLVTDTLTGGDVCCSFTNGDSELVLQYTVSRTTPPLEFPKDEEEPELYVSSGIEHHIMTNEDEYVAVWVYEDVMCSITGIESKSELLKIVDSIYER